MYETFYQLQAKAFHLNPDPRFLFASSKHSRVLDYLRYGLYKGEGLIVVTGDVGTGKTTLVYKLLEDLAEQKNIIAAHLVATQRKAEYLLPMVATAFGLIHDEISNVILLKQLEKFLIDQTREGRRVLLIVDEAQNLSMQALEVLRLLTNYQINYKASLQIFLVGQAEFRNILLSERLEQLRQRVIATCHLGPMELDEIRCYIEHRLSVVGWSGDPTFTPEAYVAIHNYTGGVPRRINMLCNRVLTLGCLEEAHKITEKLVNTIIQEMDEELLGTNRQRQDLGNIRILHKQPIASPDMVNEAISKIRSLNLDSQESNQAAQSTSVVQPQPEALASAMETLGLPAIKNKSTNSKSASTYPQILTKPTLVHSNVQPDMPPHLLTKQQAPQVDNHGQQHVFFRKQRSLLGLLLFILILISAGIYYLLTYYDGIWSVQRMLATGTGSAPPRPVVPKVQTGTMSIAENASKRLLISKEQVIPIKPQESVSGLAAQRSTTTELAMTEPESIKPDLGPPISQPEPIEANAKSDLNKPSAQQIRLGDESSLAVMKAKPLSVESVTHSMVGSPSSVANATLTPSKPVSSATQKTLTEAQPAAVISIADYMHKGDRWLELGDIASARLFYEAAARTGYAPALTAVGKTYDPQVLSHQGLRGVYTDPVKAAQWYRQAVQAGDPEAENYLHSVLLLLEFRD